ncbi:ankyrin repeat-containing domain protein [Aspergillus transmontanensis]|uniref:Ankyrin repeat-containing domain protein n=1 Tax=Aspergillus transmontanensis TaxID=1034304 RepID=A0A5N6WFH0_9EURO|nr:ankyrin repeat-containing domain protein [Aspergillus transmontanensis]
MEVCSQIQDLELYISSRFQDSEFPDAEDFTQEIMRKSSNVFLHVKLILDELMDLTTIRQMRKALAKESKGLEQAYTSIVQRIDIQPKAKRALARRFIGWIAFAKRRFKLNEVIHAFAVEKDEEEIHDDNTTCLRYMCLKPFRQGPCASSAELSCRFQDMVFLGYASRHWGEHLHELEDLEADTESLVQFLILDGNLRDAAVQALHFYNGCETDLSNALFEDIPAKQTALHVAAYWNLTRNLKALIESALDTSSKDTQGWTPLHYACANGHFASAELLIESGADIDSSDDQGWTPLFWASFTGCLDIVRLLLSNHAKYTRRSKSGYTALHWAISRGETEVVQALLQHHQTQLSLTLKADIRMLSVDDVRRLSTPVGVSPIQVAAEAKHAPIFDLLVAYLQAPGSRVKDDVFQKLWSRESFKVPVTENAWRTLLKSSRGGRSSKKTNALVHSAETISGQTYLAEDPSKYFKKEWVETSPSAWKAIVLGSTIRDGYLNAARLLVETGVDVNFDSKEGPPLHIAAFQKDPSFARLLLDNGAKPDRQSGMGEFTLNVAICHGNLETAKVILTSHHDVNFQCHHGTPLHVAAGQEDPRFAELLLENGANPRNSDFHGRYPLHIAVMNGFIETARAIIDGGADINQFSLQFGGILRMEHVPQSKTCLMLAVLLANKANGKQEALATEMARMLLSKGADPRLQNSEGETVLHIAAMCGLLSFIEPLVTTGSIVDTVDNMGRTAIHTMMQFAEVGWDVDEVRRALRLMLQGLPERPVASLLNQQAWKPILQDSFNQYVRLTGQVLQDRSASMLDISKTFTLKLDTPLTLALRRKAWEIPATPYLQSIFAAATRDLDYEIMDILLGYGVSPNEDAALVLPFRALWLA